MRRKTLKSFITNGDKVTWDRSRVSRYLMCVSALVFGMLIPGRIVVVTSPSLDHRIFLISHASPQEIKKKDYVLFTLQSHYIKKGKPTKVMKEVACVGNERLETKVREYYCNNEHLGTAKQWTLTGEPVEPFVYSGTIPEGELFVTGSHKDSLDSKYIGFVARRQIEGIGHPLL